MDDNNDSGGFGEVVERETEESTEETSESVGVDESTEDKGDEGQRVTSEDNQATKGETEQPELTEKGTKLDSNPQSALHQQLANERRVKSQMEEVLGNPQALARFMEQQYGIKVPVGDNAPTEVPAQAKRYTAQDFQNIDDVAGKFNELQEGFDQKTKAYEDQINRLANTVTALADGSRENQMLSTMEGDAKSLRSVPELDSSNPDFVKGLETKIVERYIQQDFDQQTGRFRGGTTLKAVADDLIEAINLGRQSGSLRAQTVVRNRTEGRVRTSPSASESVDTDKMSPGDSIAAGIKKLGLR